MRSLFTKIVMSLVLLMAPTIVSAQYASINTPNNNGHPYWDNTSDDGQFCNIGFVLVGTATAGNCASDRPNGAFPIDPSMRLTSTDEYKTTPGFGLFNNVATLTVFGDIAGQDRGWGWFSNTDRVGSRVNLNGQYGMLGNIGLVGTQWGLWAQLTDGTYVYSDNETSFGQFAFFRPQGNSTMLAFGVEDINLHGDSDADYNDVSGRLEFKTPDTTVPEPSTYVLMATGLAGVGMIARRKNKTT